MTDVKNIAPATGDVLVNLLRESGAILGNDAANALEAQARRISELEAECEKLGRLYLEVIADWNIAVLRIETLESTLKMLSESNYYPDSVLDKRIREDRIALEKKND